MQTATVVHESSLGRLTLRTAKPEDDSRVPMFRSMEAALLFAYTWRARPGVKAATYDEFTGSDGSVLLLSVGEKKIQSEAIHDVFKTHLSIDQRALLDASHGGERGERHAGVERLVCKFEHAHRNRSLVRMIVAREFIYGEEYCPGLRDIGRGCGVHPFTVSRAAAKITPEIAELHKATHAKLQPAFERRGWIAREAEQSQ